jgi:hypothetical protein
VTLARLAAMTLAASSPELSLYAELGKQVGLDGRIATVIAQHPVSGVSGKTHVYLDVPGNQQTVAYVPKGFDCNGAVMLEGRVIEVVAGGKRQKSEEVFKVAHLDVEKWQCLPASVDELLEAVEKAAAPAERAKAQERVFALGRGALPGLVRLSSRPAAAELLNAMVKPKAKVDDWPKWWRARWKKSLDELRAEGA